MGDDDFDNGTETRVEGEGEGYYISTSDESGWRKLGVCRLMCGCDCKGASGSGAQTQRL